MKKIFLFAFLTVFIGLMIGLNGCGKEDSIVSSTSPQQGLRSTTSIVTGGTTLSGTMDIYCTNFFKWTFTKSMDQTPDSICENECQDIEVIVTATKGMQVTGFNGKINIKNTGEYATENLKINITVMKSCNGGEYEVVRDAVPVDVSQKPVLGPGEFYLYGYAVNVAQFGGIDPNCMYKVVAHVTITNYLDHIGQEFGIDLEASTQGCPPSNDCVTVFDIPGTITPSNPEVPTSGWNITVSPSSLEFCESGTAMFVLHVCNKGVPTEETFRAENKLVVDNQIVATAYYYLTTLGCTPYGGCTRTIGFYKTHAVEGLYGNNHDMVSAYLPIYLGMVGGSKTVVVNANTQVVSIMKFTGPGGASNGILKLYAQMLAAKLNIAGANGSGMGSDGSCIARTIEEADAFLANYNANDWSSLTKDQKKMVIGWMNTFDKYNNGLLCAYHCDTMGDQNN